MKSQPRDLFHSQVDSLLLRLSDRDQFNWFLLPVYSCCEKSVVKVKFPSGMKFSDQATSRMARMSSSLDFDSAICSNWHGSGLAFCRECGIWLKFPCLSILSEGFQGGSEFYLMELGSSERMELSILIYVYLQRFYRYLYNLGISWYVVYAAKPNATCKNTTWSHPFRLDMNSTNLQAHLSSCQTGPWDYKPRMAWDQKRWHESPMHFNLFDICSSNIYKQRKGSKKSGKATNMP